jgi:O-antigen ligase
MTALRATTPDTGRLHHLWLVLLLAWPWVQPFSSSPLPHVWPWLTSWVCLALALLTWQRLSVAIVVQSWAMAALLSSVMGLVQFFGQAELLAPALHVPGYLGDAMGNLRQRNQLATLLAMGVLAVLIWRAFGLSMVHALWMLALLAIGMAATASRTGLLQLVFVGLWMLLHRAAPQGREALWLSGFLLCMYALASWLLPQLLQQWSGQATDSAMARMGALGGCGSRQALWANVLHLVAQHPLRGWGWDELRYAHYITEYPSLRFCDMLGNAHNLPLHIAFVGRSRCCVGDPGCAGLGGSGQALASPRGRATACLGRARCLGPAQFARVPAVVRPISGGLAAVSLAHAGACLAIFASADPCGGVGLGFGRRFGVCGL